MPPTSSVSFTGQTGAVKSPTAPIYCPVSHARVKIGQVVCTITQMTAMPARSKAVARPRPSSGRALRQHVQQSVRLRHPPCPQRGRDLQEHDGDDGERDQLRHTRDGCREQVAPGDIHAHQHHQQQDQAGAEDIQPLRHPIQQSQRERVPPRGLGSGQGITRYPSPSAARPPRRASRSCRWTAPRTQVCLARRARPPRIERRSSCHLPRPRASPAARR